jgi:peptidoglycan/LPS O-acetylase OafA/YrhL
MASVTRNQSLDILRAIAILLVLGRHFPHYAFWGQIGWIGVDLFFVLSGFLISGILFQEFKQTGTIRFSRFIVRRGLKIWPALYFFLICMAAPLALSHQPFPRDLFAAAAGFYINYSFSIAHHGVVRSTSFVLSHTWSLAVEEHFYLFLPLLLILLIRFRRNFRLIPFLFAGIVALSLALRVMTHPLEAYATHLRMDGLFAGVTLAYLYHFKPSGFQELTRNYVLLFLLPAMIVPALYPWESRVMQTVGLSCLWAAFSLLVAWASVRRASSRLGQFLARALAFVGLHSYSIYLWHAPLAVLFRFSHLASATSFWGYIVAAIGVGAGMSRVIEQPVLRLRDKWWDFEAHNSGSAGAVEQATVPVV